MSGIYKTYCLGCKNIDCTNYGRGLSFSWECNKYIENPNMSKVIKPSSIDGLVDTLTEAFNISIEEGNINKDKLKEWLLNEQSK